MSRTDRERDLRQRFEAMKAKRQPTSVAAFARSAGINRTYLYTFGALAAEVSSYAKRTQPRTSHQAGKILRSPARARELDRRVRREHARWSKELPKLRAEITRLKQRGEEMERELAAAERISGAYDLLLLLAHEAGVSPLEMEKIQTSVSRSGGAEASS